MLASSSTVDFTEILRHLALVLIVAKLAAEAAERIRVPAVLGEIVAGIIIGPSVLGLVDPSDALKILAEIGVVILLANVGMETDLNELRRVGRSALAVAVIGVVVPMGLGIGAGRVLGESGNASVFLGAALAATSVGITARVFGDLRALASTEARIVLGAAVADDVLGLVILTVVTRIVEQGSVDAVGIATTVGLAVAFLLVAVGLGVTVVPRLMGRVGALAVSGTTVGVVGAGITFAFAAAAGASNLAPIIGAFVAGTALGRSPHHERMERDLSSVGSVFIPVFFLQIGIDTDVTKFVQAHVLFVAAVLFVIAVLGKVVAGLGAPRASSDRLLIGLGMVPRGEVGLIFATIGMSVGVFHEDLYAVVLLVVLLSTLVTPPLLRWRLTAPVTSASHEAPGAEATAPHGGWVREAEGRISIAGSPGAGDTLRVALDAARACTDASPGPDLMDWLHGHRADTLSWSRESTAAFMDVVRSGNARSWRLLEITNVLDRALPEVAHSLDTRRSETTELDPTHATHLATLETVRQRLGQAVDGADSLLLAALLVDLDMSNSATEETLAALVLPEPVRRETSALLSASTLLCATVASEPYVHNPRVLGQLAEYLRSPLTVERCRILAEARHDFTGWQYSVLLEITTGVQSLLAHPELLDGGAESLETINRRDAIALTEDPLVRDRIMHASPGYVVSHDPSTIVRHAELVEPAPRGRTVRVNVHEGPESGSWTVDIAARDARGLLARIAGVLAGRGLDIVTADLATWPDGAVLDTFTVRSSSRPNPAVISFDLERSLRQRLSIPRRVETGISRGVVLQLDNESHPWHSTVIVSGADQPGLLQSVASAFAKAGVSVQHARIYTDGGVVTDRFEVTDRHGRKITPSTMATVESLLA